MPVLPPLAATVAALSLLPAATPPASTPQASGSLHATNDVLYPGCHHRAYRYDVDAPTDDWYLSVTIEGPTGKVFATDHPYAGDGGSYLQLCDYDPTGRYRLTAKGEWYDAEGGAHPFAVDPTSFSVRRPKTRASISVSHGRVTVTGRGEQRSTYTSLAGATIALQRRRGGGWATVSTKHVDGRATFTPHSGRYRAVVTAQYHTRSVSRAVTV